MVPLAGIFLVRQKEMFSNGSFCSTGASWPCERCIWTSGSPVYLVGRQWNGCSINIVFFMDPLLGIPWPFRCLIYIILSEDRLKGGYYQPIKGFSPEKSGKQHTDDFFFFFLNATSITTLLPDVVQRKTHAIMCSVELPLPDWNSGKRNPVVDA